MALYQPPGSSFWWFEFQYAGHRYRESTKTGTKQVAAERMRMRRRQIEEFASGFRKREPVRLFPAAAEEYQMAKRSTWSDSNKRIERRAVEHLLPYFKKMFVPEITILDIQNFIESQLSRGCSRQGVNMKLRTLRAILRRNHAWEWIRPDFSMLSVGESIGQALTLVQKDILLAACGKSISRVLLPVVTLALNTGMRHDEIRLLRWRQVNLEGAYLNVGRSKTANGAGRMVPLNNQALRALTIWASKFPNLFPESYVFQAEKYSLGKGDMPANIYSQDPSKPIGSWKTALNAAFRRVGFRVRFHDFRHTAVTMMLGAGVPLTTVASIMGWSAATMHMMAKRYAHLCDKTMRGALAVLDGSGTAQSPIPEERAKKRSNVKSKIVKKEPKRERRADKNAA